MKVKMTDSMLSRREFLRLVGILGLSGNALVGPGSLLTKLPYGLSRAEAKRAGTLRVGWEPPSALDPALFSNNTGASLGISVYDYLINLDPQQHLVPNLAKKWDISKDGKEYTFSLETGVKFHDGSDFSADDVKWTFDRLRDHATGSVGESLFSNVDKIEVIDAATVKFTLKAPDPVLLYSIADYHCCILKKNTTDPAKEFNGTGPFKMTKIDVTDRASLVANETYWKPDQPKLAGLEMLFLKNISDLVTALQGGSIDWVAQIPVELFGALKSDANLVTVDVPTNEFAHIRIRADRKPGNDVKVRQAFRLAMDRDAINKAAFQGLGAIGRDSPIGPLYKDYYTEATPLPKRDPAAAKKLLEEAGYKDGLTMDFYVADATGYADIAQVLQAQWKEAGITVNLKVTPQSVYYSDAPNNWLDADLGMTGWSTRPDPQIYMDVMIKSDGYWNEAHWKDEEVDKQIAAAASTTDVKERAKAYAEIQRIMIERGPSYIPVFTPLLAAQSKKVQGIDLAAFSGMTDFRNVTIEG